MPWLRLCSSQGSEQSIEAAKGKGKAMALMYLAWKGKGKGKGGKGGDGECKGEPSKATEVKVEKGQSFEEESSPKAPKQLKRLKKVKTQDLLALEDATGGVEKPATPTDGEKKGSPDPKKPKAMSKSLWMLRQSRTPKRSSASKAAAKPKTKTPAESAESEKGGTKRGANSGDTETGDEPKTKRKKSANSSPEQPGSEVAPKAAAKKKYTAEVGQGPFVRLRTKTSQESLESASGFKTPPTKKPKTSSPGDPTLGSKVYIYPGFSFIV